MNYKKHAVFTLLAALLLVLGPLSRGEAKIFENITRGGRALGVGGAFTAGDGSDALFYNVAGLSSVKGLEAGFSFQPNNMYEDLRTLGASLVYGFPGFAVGGYMNMLTLDGFTSETTVVVGGALELPVLKNIFKRVSVGAAFRMYLLTKDFTLGTEKDSDQAISCDFGIRAQVGDSFAFGFSVLNMLAPELSFFDGGAGTGEATDREIRLGVRFNPLKEFALYGDYVFYPEADSNLGMHGVHLGAEVVFYDVFMLRFGVDEGDLTIGAGLAAKHVDINLAIKSKGVMGLYYQAGLVVKL